MGNRVQFKRRTSSGTPPATLTPGEPIAVLDQAGRVDLYVGDATGATVLINPAPTPIGGVELSYTWDSNQAISAPAPGDVKINGDQSGTPTVATTMSISNVTTLGTDASAIFNNLRAGDFLGLFEQGGGGGAGGETFYWQVSGPAVDNTTWFEIPGSVQFYGGNDIDNNRPTSVFLINDPTRSAMVWQREWDPAVLLYSKDDVVRDGSWTMIANTETSQRPAPQPVGNPTAFYTGASPTRAATVKSVTYGTRYQFTTPKLVDRLRAYVVTGNDYVVYLIEDPGGTDVIREIISFTARQTGWVDLNLAPAVFNANAIFELVVVAQEPDPTPTIFTGDWNYITPNNASVPASGQVTHADKLQSQLRVHKTDDGGMDRSADLATIVAGDIIRAQGIRYSVSQVSDQGAYINFDVAPAIQGASDGVTTFTFETVTSSPVTIVDDVDWWLTNGGGQAQGLFAQDGATPVLDNSAYGIDLYVQDVSVSSDWDVVSYSGDSGAVGGGLPAGGAAGEILKKASATDGDAVWSNVIDGGRI